jgi:YfiH family protein
VSSERSTNLAEQRIADRGVERYELEAWQARFGIVAGITGRGFDLGLASQRSTGEVLERWQRLQADAFPQFPSIVVSRQIHGARIARYAPLPPGILIGDGWDGHVTRVPGQLLAVTVADCAPIYLVDRGSRAIGLLHAGWKGIAAGIVEHGIETLCDVAQCSTRDIVMHCGTSICGACYEVGPEVLGAVLGRPAAAKGLLDLRSTIADRAWATGVREITVSQWCTAHHGDRFESHRGSAGRAGRMVAFAGRLPS